jgi:tripartite-type tricarboxylate transporter receptor subunit TctC
MAGKTPRPIVERTSKALIESLNDPTIKQRIEGMQITLELGGPDVQRKFLADQMKLWGPVVKDNNIKADG